MSIVVQSNNPRETLNDCNKGSYSQVQSSPVQSGSMQVSPVEGLKYLPTVSPLAIAQI